ncbi:MAG: sigma-70 family RNA polymerase sigma factor [Labilithrix sp.]|nr:sigma-70 family RNA polymerase sigma factor [Labilithrix sp.]
MRRALVVLVVVLLVACSRRASADAGGEDDPGERARFVLASSASAAARSCAGAEVLRAKVAERLGRDPFTSSSTARGRLEVAFARDGARAWTAEIALFDASGERIGGRSLARAGATCEPLVGSVVFTIAVLLEDLAPPEPAPRPSPPPPTAPPPSPPAPGAGASGPTARAAPRYVAVGGAGALGAETPAPSVGGSTFGVDLARLRVELAGRLFLPASSEGDVAVRTRLVHGRLAPCYGWVVLAGCVVAAVGSVSGEAVGDGVVSSRLAGQLYAAGGVGVLSRVFVVDDLLFARASLDLLFAATRAGFDVGERRVWTAPVVFGGRRRAQPAVNRATATAPLPTFREIFELEALFVRLVRCLGIHGAELPDTLQGSSWASPSSAGFQISLRGRSNTIGSSASTTQSGPPCRGGAPAARGPVEDHEPRLDPRGRGAIERNETRDLARQALSKVEPSRRAVLILSYYEGLSVPDIAAALQIPVNTAYSRLNRARQSSCRRRKLGRA